MAVKVHVKNFQSLKNTGLEIKGFTAITGPNNSGKALAHGTLVATPQGWVPVERVRLGDNVLAGDGSSTLVTGVYPQGVRETVEVKFDDGRTVFVDHDHLWQVSIGEDRFPGKGKDQRWRVLTTAEIRRRVGDVPSGFQRPAIPMAGPAQYERLNTHFGLDPYVMGVLLGDGCFQATSVRVSSADSEVLHQVELGLPAAVRLTPAGGYDFRLVSKKGQPNPVLDFLRRCELAGLRAHEKFIPVEYQQGSVLERVALLQGLMDTDGTVNSQGIPEFCTTSEKLAKGFLELVHSLGATARSRSKTTTYSHKGVKKTGRKAYIVTFRLSGIDLFRLPRKQALLKALVRRVQPLMVAFSDGPRVPCTCISVAHGSHLFQIEGHLVTHNTALMRAIRGVFQNTPGTSFISHGSEEMEVSLSFSDGRSIIWQKGTTARSKPTYIIDGGKPIHPGRAVPDEVREFNVNPIRVMGQEVWPTLAPQFTGQVFLLDQPGSALAEAVADVDRVAKLNGALRSADRDLRAASSKLKVRREDRVSLIEDLQRFDGLDTVDAQVVAIEQDIGKADRLHRALGTMQDYRTKLTTAHEEVLKLTPIEEVQLPDAREATILMGKLGDLKSLSPRLHRSRRLVESLAPAAEVEVPSVDMPALKALLDERDALRTLCQSKGSAQGVVSKLAGVENVALSGLDTEQASRTAAALEFLQDARSRLKAAHQAVADLEAEHLSFSSEADRVGQEVVALLSECGVCPTCGSHLEGHGH